MTEQRKILTQAEQAQALLSTAAELMTDGRLVSIAALRKMVESLCSAVASTPAEERASFAPVMRDLTAKIDAFRFEMTESYSRLTKGEQ